MCNNVPLTACVGSATLPWMCLCWRWAFDSVVASSWPSKTRVFSEQVFVSSVPNFVCGFLDTTDPNGRSMADRIAASQRGRLRRLRCHWRHELSLRMAVAASIRGGSAGGRVCRDGPARSCPRSASRSRLSTHGAGRDGHRLGAGCRCSLLRFQGRSRGADGGTRGCGNQAKLAEVVQPRLQERFREHIVEDSGIPRGPR